MSDTQHVSQDDLLEMLDSENDSPHVNRIGDHLHNCSSCRNKLDSLAAQSVMWNKAPTMLKSDLPVRASLSSTGLETKEHNVSGQQDSEPSPWAWPIESLLDSPRHPEMMGRIGDYDIEREIGSGGMGIVLKAHEAELNRPLAIKVLAPHLASHGTARQRFAKEARAAAGVIHPNVIAVHRVDNSGKIPYIVMPYIAGPSMQALVEEQGPLAEEEIVRMSLQISAGLTAAHSQGLVHRDIKPANILVADGGNRVMITDFGLARAEDDASLTRTGWLTGTPNYMSPEQTRGERLDQRSDLFSLGSLIYFLATGRLPFRSDSPLGVLRRIQEDKPTPVRQVNRNISKTLEDVIDVLLEKNPADRFQSAADLHDVLSRQMFYLHQPDISQPPVVKKELAPSNQGRNVFWGGTVGAIALAAFGFWMFAPGMIPQEEDQPRQQEETAQVQVEVQEESSESARQILNTVRQSTVQRKETRSPQQEASAQVQIQQQSAKQNDGQKPRRLKEAEIDAIAKALINTPPTINKINIGGSDHVVIHEDEKQTKAQRAFEDGWERLREEDYAAAAESFKLAAEDSDIKAMSLYNVGCSYALMGETEKALFNLELAIDEGFDRYQKFKDDDDLDSLREDDRFKDILADLKEIEQAREQLGEALQEIDLEHYASAVEIIEGVMEIDPNNEKAWLNLGYALHMEKDYDEAMKWHMKAAAGKQHVALGNYNVACVYSIRELKDKALASLDVALENDLHYRLGPDHLENDSDLDNLRGDERFDDFVARFKEAQKPFISISMHQHSDECEDCDNESCAECEKNASEECEECEKAKAEKNDSAASPSDDPLAEEEELELESEESEVEEDSDDEDESDIDDSVIS